MEEGQEPQELFEQVEHNKHVSSEHNGAPNRFIQRTAITASVLAVLAAFASLLSGHAGNEAILKQAEATDKWGYYEAKSTKSNVFEADKYVFESLAAPGRLTAKQIDAATHNFDQKIAKFDREKETIKASAEDFEKASTKSFSKHEDFSIAVACFQIAIVLSSVSILVQNRKLYFGSVIGGIAGILCLAVGFFVS